MSFASIAAAGVRKNLGKVKKFVVSQKWSLCTL